MIALIPLTATRAEAPVAPSSAEINAEGQLFSVRPPMEESDCSNLSKRGQNVLAKLTVDHEICLNHAGQKSSPKDGMICSVPECQDLHTAVNQFPKYLQAVDRQCHSKLTSHQKVMAEISAQKKREKAEAELRSQPAVEAPPPSPTRTQPIDGPCKLLGTC